MRELMRELMPRAFSAPGRVVFGVGALQEVGRLLEELGLRGGRILVVTDAAVSKLGLSGRLCEVLKRRGFSSVEFSEIHGEPSVEVVDLVIETARSEDAVAVVGVGGGSALDSAKLAAAFLTNEGTVTDALNDATWLRHPARPLVLIPTTAGTGAEATRNAVVIREGRKAFLGSRYLVPAVAVLDPELTITVPRDVTAFTGMDALSHCIEAIMSANGNALTDAIALQGARLVQAYLPRAVENGSDLEARGKMMVAAFLGGLAVNAGMVLGHSIAYTLANRLGLPHGLSCAVALPYAMEYNAGAASKRLSWIAEVFGAGSEPHAAVEMVRSLSRRIGIAGGWRELGLARDVLPELVEECLSRYPRPNNPRPLERTSLLRLYEAAWRGEPYREEG